MTAAAASQVGDWSHLEARLSSRFSRLHPDDVRRCVRDSMAQFADATIRTYLAVLVERAATDRLRVLERAMAIDASCEADSRLPIGSPLREMTRQRDNDHAVRTRQRVVSAVG